MAWFKIDDGLAFHAKTVAAGNAAMGLWTRAGSWSMQQLTDGFIPTHMVVALGTRGQAKALVTAGLWTVTDGGYRVHDWHDYQPSADEIRTEQATKHEARVRAGRLGGVASGVARRKHTRSIGPSSDEADGKQNEPPSRPVPTRPVVVVADGEEFEVELVPGVDPAELEAVVRSLRDRSA